MSSILLEYQKLQDRQPTKYNDCLENHLENGSKCNLLHFNHLLGILSMLSLNFERLTLHFNGLCGNLHWQRKGGLPVLQNLSGIFLLNCSPPFTGVLRAEQTGRQTAGLEEINRLPLTVWLTRLTMAGGFQVSSSGSSIELSLQNLLVYLYLLNPQINPEIRVFVRMEVRGLVKSLQIFWDDYQSYRGNFPCGRTWSGYATTKTTKANVEMPMMTSQMWTEFHR